MSRRYTMRDVRQSYRDQKREEEIYGEWGAVVFYRPISYVITPWFLNASISATTVTVMALAVVATLPMLALLGGAFGYAWLAFGGVVVAVLDCIDGNIARTNGTAGPRGGYIDFITDIIFRVVFYASIGLLVERGDFAIPIVGGYAPAVAIGAAWLAVTARLSRVYAENKLDSDNPYGAPTSDDPAGRMSPGDYVFAFVSGIDPLLPVIVLIAGYFDALGWVLVWLFVYSLGDFLLTQSSIVRRLKP